MMSNEYPIETAPSGVLVDVYLPWLRIKKWRPARKSKLWKVYYSNNLVRFFRPEDRQPTMWRNHEKIYETKSLDERKRCCHKDDG